MYIEYLVGASWTGSDSGIGIATAGAVFSSMGISGANSFLVFPSGNIWFNGSSTGSSLGSISSGTLIGMAIDFTNSTGWFRKATGNWNGSGTANPATNTGGINISALFPSSAAFAAFCTSAVNDTMSVYQRAALWLLGLGLSNGVLLPAAIPRRSMLESFAQTVPASHRGTRSMVCSGLMQRCVQIAQLSAAQLLTDSGLQAKPHPAAQW
ncbi:hypothetical protein LRP30_07525 [Bradyrhizobium sp. C-145]|uniref:hypothetical protein n=1 Tax=Bradyrhizobium sp. C-145 TaxID=574727 RepID=UPI00201B515D|nr:hypothetical protein [Bradyrhizobium sp. C-145]UQR65096.1 hypothetical protein LRP30_07525 [Bradyrhizobium sp. C-145]